MPSTLLSGFREERQGPLRGSRSLFSREEIRERKKALMESLKIEVQAECDKVESLPASKLFPGPRQDKTMADWDPFRDG